LEVVSNALELEDWISNGQKKELEVNACSAAADQINSEAVVSKLRNYA